MDKAEEEKNIEAMQKELKAVLDKYGYRLKPRITIDGDEVHSNVIFVKYKKDSGLNLIPPKGMKI